MKYKILIAMTLLLSGCEDKTDFGRCVGLLDERDPALKWKVSTANALAGAILIETVMVPVYVLLERTYCPVGRK